MISDSLKKRTSNFAQDRVGYDAFKKPLELIAFRVMRSTTNDDDELILAALLGARQWDRCIPHEQRAEVLARVRQLVLADKKARVLHEQCTTTVQRLALLDWEEVQNHPLLELLHRRLGPGA